MAEDKGKGAGSRRAQDDDTKGRQAKGRVSGAQDSREGPEAELGKTFAQPAPDLDTADTRDSEDAVKGKQTNLGEGAVERAAGVAAAQEGNEQVAANFEPEQVAGFHGFNPAAEQNIHHTVAGHLEFAKLSPEEQHRVRRELHEEAQARFRGDDWS
jgi:hypothetical protein